MNALLTGITGNLGHEAALALHGAGIAVVPLVRPGRRGALADFPIAFETIFETDLTEPGAEPPAGIDCIVHAAGDVSFLSDKGVNERMMERVIALAKAADAPVYHVSTAFLYRPHEEAFVPRNNYEKDKAQAEELLTASGIPHATLRPSILTGRRADGVLRNFTGFYQAAQAFVDAARAARAEGRKARFPRLRQPANLMPVDDAARMLAALASSGARGIHYAVDANPPSFEWLLEETLRHYDLADSVEYDEGFFDSFAPSNQAEARLAGLAKHFSPYWIIDFPFPAPLNAIASIDRAYMEAMLGYYDSHAPH